MSQRIVHKGQHDVLRPGSACVGCEVVQEAVDPTQVVWMRLEDESGTEVVAAPGTAYRASDSEGVYGQDLVVVLMTQEQYNRVQGELG